MQRRRRDCKLVNVPPGSTTHIGSQHSMNTRFRPVTEIRRAHVNRLCFFHRHYGSAEPALLRGPMALGASLRIARLAWMYLFKRSARHLAAGQMKGFWMMVPASLSRRPDHLPAALHKPAGGRTACRTFRPPSSLGPSPCAVATASAYRLPR